ncbi:hypothetical protein HA466_0223040 [Hirschfeldia incana]|nr:hypothetical protein HA466_0223040 [Hirschfeldia incana]
MERKLRWKQSRGIDMTGMKVTASDPSQHNNKKTPIFLHSGVLFDNDVGLPRITSTKSSIGHSGGEDMWRMKKTAVDRAHLDSSVYFKEIFMKRKTIKRKER